MSGDAGQMHTPGAVPDEEQHIKPTQEYGVEVEEIHRGD
jgi:hypothetical protein